MTPAPGQTAVAERRPRSRPVHLRGSAETRAPAWVPRLAALPAAARMNPMRVVRAALVLLAGVSVVVVAFAAFAVVGQGWVQHRQQTALQASFHRVLSLAQAGSSSAGGFFGTSAHVRPPSSRATALLEIPAVHLTEAVLPGTTAANLAEGPALSRSGAAPGGFGNVVIAGHRTVDGGPFYRLDNLKSGDLITLMTTKGRFVYQVISVDVVSPGDRSALGSFPDRRLTLTAGDPVFRESHPLVVQAVLLSQTRWPGAGAPSDAPPGLNRPAADLPGSGGDWPWLVLGLLLAAGAVALPRLWRRIPAVRFEARAAWLVAAPLALAGVLLVFHSVALMLPATI